MEQIQRINSIRQPLSDKNAVVNKVYSVSEINCLIKGAIPSNIVSGGGCLFRPTNDSSFEVSLEYKPLENSPLKNHRKKIRMRKSHRYDERIKVTKMKNSGVGVRKCEKISIGSVTLPIDLVNTDLSTFQSPRALIGKNSTKNSLRKINKIPIIPTQEEGDENLLSKPLEFQKRKINANSTIALTSTPIKSVEIPRKVVHPLYVEGGESWTKTDEFGEDSEENGEETNTMIVDCVEMDKSKLVESKDHAINDEICAVPLTRENVERYGSGENENTFFNDDEGVEWGQNFDFSFICEPSTSDAEDEESLNTSLDPPELLPAQPMTRNVSCAKIATIHQNADMKPVVQQTFTKYSSAIQSASIKSIELFTVSLPHFFLYSLDISRNLGVDRYEEICGRGGGAEGIVKREI